MVGYIHVSPNIEIWHQSISKDVKNAISHHVVDIMIYCGLEIFA